MQEQIGATWTLASASETETTNVPPPEETMAWFEVELDRDVYEALEARAKENGQTPFEAAMEIVNKEIERRRGA